MEAPVVVYDRGSNNAVLSGEVSIKMERGALVMRQEAGRRAGRVTPVGS